MALTDRILLVCQFKEVYILPCYHPQLMEYRGIKDNGKPNYVMAHRQGCRSYQYNEPLNKDILVPCRKCIGCRLDYSRRWADRLVLELDHSKTALFFTLTYDNDHITPAMYDDYLDVWYYTLVKKDLQDFNKRLRYYFADREIRFFAAGEYGEKLRPHYHGIYFGLSLDDFPDHQLLFYNNHKQPIYISEKLSMIWKNGHVSIGLVSWQSCAYVARYNLKKLAHDSSDLICESRNCIPEFGLMSRNPGIAGYFPIDHPEIFDSPRDKIIITDNNGVRSVGSIALPSYLFQKLELVNPELYAIIKEEKKVASEERFLAELSNTDLDEYEYLDMKEILHERKAQRLVRPIE